MVQDVLADADTRASLLQNGAMAGYNGGFFIGSTDGDFSLKINGQVQSRYVHNNRDMPPGDGDERRRAAKSRRILHSSTGNRAGNRRQRAGIARQQATIT